MYDGQSPLKDHKYPIQTAIDQSQLWISMPNSNSNIFPPFPPSAHFLAKHMHNTDRERYNRWER